MQKQETACPCKNGYNEDTFMESFGKDDESMKKCNHCDNMTYENGIMSCEKFNK